MSVRDLYTPIARLGEGGMAEVFKAKLVPKAAGKQTSLIRVIERNGAVSQSAVEANVVGFSALAVQVTGGDGPLTVGGQARYRIAISG